MLNLYFLNLFFIIPLVLCEKRIPCDFSDELCVTNVAKKILFKRVIAGNSTFNIPPGDPLHENKIQANLPGMDITLTDAFMHGTKNCEVQRLKINPDDWYYSLLCPKLTVEADYEINGDVDSVHIEGKGRCEIVYNNYHIGTYGGYETFTTKDGVPHLNLTFFTMDFLDVQGSVIYNFTNLFNGDNQKSVDTHEYINQNWKKLHNIIGHPITYGLIKHLIENINNLLNILPKSNVFYKIESTD